MPSSQVHFEMPLNVDSLRFGFSFMLLLSTTSSLAQKPTHEPNIAWRSLTKLKPAAIQPLVSL